MSEMWDDIRSFHKKFKLPQCNVPSLLEKEMYEFRLRFMQEELEEFGEAVKNNDRMKAFDALLDLVYVAMGTAYMMNMPWDDGWRHVQNANMVKVRALRESDSTRGSTYDVVKPKGWIPPDRLLLAEILIHEHHELVRINLTVEPEVKHEQT